MDKKKVAVLLPWLKMGGTNKIALNFLSELSEYCDVTLILSEKTGELLGDLPKNISLIIDEMKDFKAIFKEDIKRVRIKRIIQDLIYYLKIRMGKDSIDNYKYIVDRHGYVTEENYDCAISYHGQSPERLLNLIYRIHSKQKVAWIHGEVSFSEDKCNRLKKYYNQMDHFFFVSNPTKESFMKIFPIEEKKTTVYYNPIDKNDIVKKSLYKFQPEFSKDFCNIVTVGRISAEKGQDMIPPITRRLLDDGFKIRWYVIGDGDTRKKLEELIDTYDVKDNVILLGTQNNPYCYMRVCDIYVQPSYTEGYSTTICEAGMLGKAIIGTTPSGGIKDQISHLEDGLIVDATIEDLFEGIKLLLNNPQTKFLFEKKIIEKNFEGKGEIKKFIDYIN